MRSGTLKHRIVIQQRGPARDAAGQPSNAWITFADSVPANILFMTGKQYATSNSQVSSATVSIRLRYRTDLNASMRVVHGITVYDILAVLPDQDHYDHVDLACNTGASNG